MFLQRESTLCGARPSHEPNLCLLLLQTKTLLWVLAPPWPSNPSHQGTPGTKKITIPQKNPSSTVLIVNTQVLLCFAISFWKAGESQKQPLFNATLLLLADNMTFWGALKAFPVRWVGSCMSHYGSEMVWL